MQIATAKKDKKANQEVFLAAYAESVSVKGAAKSAKIDRQTHYKWIWTDPDYKERFEEVRSRAVHSLAEEAARRAVEGTRKMKFHQGVPCMVPAFDEDGSRKIDPETGEEAWEPYVEHEYSDTLLMFLMKAADPKTYNDRLAANVNVTHSGEVGITGVSTAIQEMLQEPGYVDYLRSQVGEDDDVAASDGDAS